MSERPSLSPFAPIDGEYLPPGSPLHGPYVSLDEIMSREAQIMTRPVRLLNSHQYETRGHVVSFVVYEHESPPLANGIRWAVYVDGAQSSGGIGWNE